MKFTKEDIGKKVVVSNNSDLYHFIEGTLCQEAQQGIGERLWIGVDIGEELGLHNCDGACSEGCGIWVFEEDFELS